MNKNIKYVVESFFDDDTYLSNDIYNDVAQDILKKYEWIPEYLFKTIKENFNNIGSNASNTPAAIVEILEKVKPDMLSQIQVGSFDVFQHFGSNVYKISSERGGLSFRDFIGYIYKLFSGHVIDLNWMDVSKLKELPHTFKDLGQDNKLNYHYTSFARTADEEPIETIIDISHWDVRNITTLDSTFENTSARIIADGWELDSCIGLNSTFKNADIVDKSIETWKFKQLEFIMWGFQGAQKINADLSKWNTKTVKNLFAAFQGVCFGEDTQWIGNLNVSNVQTFDSCFAETSGWLDLSNWNVKKGKSFISMFEKTGIYDANINGWDVRKAKSISNMFRSSEYRGDLSSWPDKNRLFYNDRDAWWYCVGKPIA